MRQAQTYAGRHGRRIRRLGDPVSAAVSLAQFTTDQIISAHDWLKNTAQQADQERIQQTQWLAANGATLTDQGKQQYIAGLQAKTEAVNELYDGLSILESVIPQSALGSLGIAPLVVAGIIVAILAAAGIAIYAIYAKIQAADAQMAQAQNMKAVANSVAQKISTASPDDAAKIIAAWAAANNPQSQQPFPWSTLFISLAVGGVAYAVFG